MTGDLDLRGHKLINPSEINMNRKLITNLDTDTTKDLVAVNIITLKNELAKKSDMNDHKQLRELIDKKVDVNIYDSNLKALNEKITQEVLPLATKIYVDQKNNQLKTDLETNINSKTDTTYVDQKDTKLKTEIQTKLDKKAALLYINGLQRLLSDEIAKNYQIQ